MPRATDATWNFYQGECTVKLSVNTLSWNQRGLCSGSGKGWREWIETGGQNGEAESFKVIGLP